MINITSPEASFLNFNYVDTNSCDDEADIALPVCGDLSIRAQFDINSDTLLDTETNYFYVAICDSDCNVIFDNDTYLQAICNIRRFATREDTVGYPEIDDTNPINLCNEDYKTSIDEYTFAANPFNPITSTDLTFDFIFTPIGKQLQLYIQNKVYILEWDYLISGNYSYTIQDNVYFVKIKYQTALSSKAHLRGFLQDVVDANHGTTSSFVGDTFTIADIPSGSYINNNEWVDSPATITAVNEEGKYFYWNNSALHYTALGSSLNTISYKFEYGLTAGQAYSFKYVFNSLYTNFTGDITFDNGIDPAIIVPFSVTDYTGEIEGYLTATSTATYDVTFSITDASGHLNGFNIENINVYNTVIYDVTSSSGTLPTLELGTYTKTQLVDAISQVLGVPFDCEYTSCCELGDLEFTALIGETNYEFVLGNYWNKGYIDYPTIPVCDTTYRYNYQYITGNTWDFDFCNFTNAYFSEIYVEGDATNYGGITITDQDELWSGIMGAWGGTTFPLCVDIDTGDIYTELTFTVDDPELGLSKFKMKRSILSNVCYDCFSYCILDGDKNVVACSNQFQVTTDCCYVTKLEYWNNEDAFGFSYPAGVTNTIQLPFFIHSPKHLTKEKIYRRTDGTYRRLSADIEKEYTCETDYFKEYLHDRLIVALKHDNVTITSNRLNITESVSQQGDYSMDWNAKIDFTAKAEFKLRTYFNGKNNNCGGNC